jgi:hypothetical protein
VRDPRARSGATLAPRAVSASTKRHLAHEPRSISDTFILGNGRIGAAVTLLHGRRVDVSLSDDPSPRNGTERRTQYSDDPTFADYGQSAPCLLFRDRPRGTHRSPSNHHCCHGGGSVRHIAGRRHQVGVSSLTGGGRPADAVPHHRRPARTQRRQLQRRRSRSRQRARRRQEDHPAQRRTVRGDLRRRRFGPGYRERNQGHAKRLGGPGAGQEALVSLAPIGSV